MFSIKKRLYIFPILFILCVAFSYYIYTYYGKKIKQNNKIFESIDLFEKEYFETRSKIYRFLIYPTQKNALNLDSIFQELILKAQNIKSQVENNKEVTYLNHIIDSLNNYAYQVESIKNDKLSQQKLQNKEELDNLENKIRKQVIIGNDLVEQIYILKNSIYNKKYKYFKSTEDIIKIILLVTIILLTISSIFIYKNINNSIDILKDGLKNLFEFFNKKQDEPQLIGLNSNDELGDISKIINENIIVIRKNLKEENYSLQEVINVLSKFEKGDLSQRLSFTVTNKKIMGLKEVINNMALSLENNINKVLKVLDEYSNYNYLNSIEKDNLDSHLLRLTDGVNSLGKSITSMLLENKTNGLTLDKSSNILLLNVEKLNANSNKAAANIEETAFALEKITNNIRNNTQSISTMAELSKNVTLSSSKGEQLADKTNLSMDEINKEVTAINEAIRIIDQISFQTNILSLNAAVEAATAGEFGKGFAVVAQEVRNLSNKSAQASKEIKELVGSANNKANEGKIIVSDMIKEYKNLNLNITKTLNLIYDIQNVSKEQLLGIEQINDAINSLEKQTQQNAVIANQTNDIAIINDNIAKLIVSNTNEKEFQGKNNIKAKYIEINKNNINFENEDVYKNK